MEALTAVGLAGNILQFLDTGQKVVHLTRELHSSTTGATAENLELQKLAENLQKVAKTIQASKPISDGDSTLRDLSNQCVQISDEIQSVLNGLKVRNPLNAGESFQKAVKNAWKKGQLGDLKSRMDRISQQTCLHLAAFKLIDVIAWLNELATEIRRLDSSRAQDIEELKRGISDLSDQIAQNVDTTSPRINVPIKVSAIADISVEYCAELAILNNLRFEGLNDRHGSIVAAHEGTYSWIFNDPSAPRRPNASVQYTEWLKSGDNIFWISGKPGSGKSTLMKYLCSHEATRTHLQYWVNKRPLFPANFFFWNAGKRVLQKSQEGLLRSILFQILRQNQDLIPHALPDEWETQLANCLATGRSKSSSWSIPDLLAALQRVSEHLKNSEARFCFFIDGLDEYDGKPADVIKLIGTLSSTPNIKLCVSSRPWNEFEQAFGQDPSRKLYMQDLTREDIKIVVQEELGEAIRTLDPRDLEQYGDVFIQEIVDAAQGVFLWVVLVVRSLQDGLTNGDRIVDLQRRLRSIPTDLNEFFKKILESDVQRRYRQSAARIFLITLESRVDLPLLTYWFMDQEVPVTSSDTELQTLELHDATPRLDRMRKRLKACCKLLLEIRETSGDSSDETKMFLVSFGELNVDFIHRTVRDFLWDPDAQDLLWDWAGRDFNTDISICGGILAHIRTLPLARPTAILPLLHHRSYKELVVTFFQHLNALQDSPNTYPVLKLGMPILDQFQSAIQKHCTTFGQMIHEILGEDDYPLPTSDEKVFFLAYCVRHGLDRFVAQKLEAEPILYAPSLPTLLDSALRPLYSWTRSSMVRMLLEEGSDPNAHLPSPRPEAPTVWEQYLEHLVFEELAYKDQDVISSEGAAEKTYRIIWTLLELGADPSVVVKTYKGSLDVSQIAQEKLSAEHTQSLAHLIKNTNEKLAAKEEDSGAKQDTGNSRFDRFLRKLRLVKHRFL